MSNKFTKKLEEALKRLDEDQSTKGAGKATKGPEKGARKTIYSKDKKD